MYICKRLNTYTDMGQYQNLISSIQAVIKQNGTNDITGQLMQDTLTTIVGTIGRFATFAGVAVPSTNPNNPDQTVFYLATQIGTYVNFGGIQISGTRICAIHNIGGSWALEVIITLGDGSAVEIDPTLDPDSVNPVENRVVYNECQAIRGLIASITPTQRIVKKMLTVAEAGAIDGHTFEGKEILQFNIGATGVYDFVYFNAVQIGVGIKMMKLRTGTTSYASCEVTGISGYQTMADLVGVNHEIVDGENWVVYAEPL